MLSGFVISSRGMFGTLDLFGKSRATCDLLSVEKAGIDCRAMSMKLHRHDPIEFDKGFLLHVLE